MIADRRMALAFLLSGSAERHLMKDDAIISDLRRLPDYDSHAVIDEQIFPDLRAGMNLDSRKESTDLRNESRDKEEITPIEKMRNPMIDERMHSGIVDKYRKFVSSGRVVLYIKLKQFVERIH